MAPIYSTCPGNHNFRLMADFRPGASETKAWSPAVRNGSLKRLKKARIPPVKSSELLTIWEDGRNRAPASDHDCAASQSRQREIGKTLENSDPTGAGALLRLVCDTAAPQKRRGCQVASS